MLRTVLAVAVVVLAGTCSGPCGGASQTGGQARLNLIFTGPVAGKLSTGNIDCRIFNNKTQFNALVTGKLEGKDLVMNIQVASTYHGPDTYLIGTTLDGAANVRLQVGDFVGSSPPTAGKLIMADERSGVVDSNLGGFEHVTGSFRCAEVKSE